MRYCIVSETYPPEINGVALTVSGYALRPAGRAAAATEVGDASP